MTYELYSKVDCGFCQEAKNLLTKHDLAFIEYVLGEHLTRYELLEKFPDAKTLPIILRDGQMIGGYRELADHLAET